MSPNNKYAVQWEKLSGIVLWKYKTTTKAPKIIIRAPRKHYKGTTKAPQKHHSPHSAHKTESHYTAIFSVSESDGVRCVHGSMNLCDHYKMTANFRQFSEGRLSFCQDKRPRNHVDPVEKLRSQSPGLLRLMIVTQRDNLTGRLQVFKTPLH